MTSNSHRDFPVLRKGMRCPSPAGDRMRRVSRQPWPSTGHRRGLDVLNPRIISSTRPCAWVVDSPTHNAGRSRSPPAWQKCDPDYAVLPLRKGPRPPRALARPETSLRPIPNHRPGSRGTGILMGGPSPVHPSFRRFHISGRHHPGPKGFPVVPQNFRVYIVTDGLRTFYVSTSEGDANGYALSRNRRNRGDDPPVTVEPRTASVNLPSVRVLQPAF